MSFSALRVLCALLLLVAASSGMPDCRCPPKFRRFGRLCFHLVPAGSHDAVQVACRSLGGELASASSAHKDALLRVLLRRNRRNGVWMGLTFRMTDGSPQPHWWWSDGSTYSYTDWDEESRVGTGDCAVLLLTSGWHRVDCRHPMAGLCMATLKKGAAPCPPPALRTLQQRVRELVGVRGSQEDGDRLGRVPQRPPAPPTLAPSEREQLELSGHHQVIMMDAHILWHHWL